MAVLMSKQMVIPTVAKLLSDYAVGESIYLNVNGVLTEFFVVNQGNPNSSFYDSTCDGTWLLMKDVYEKRVWDSTNNDYENSDIHAYLNGTFSNLFDVGVRNAIKQVKLPYVKGLGTTGTSSYGANGLSTKVFLLSVYEVYNVSSYGAKNDGKILTYFKSMTTEVDSRRIAYYNGEKAIWWLRTPQNQYTNQVKCVNMSGGFGTPSPTIAYGIRPALILPSTTLTNPDTNEFLGVK